MTKVVINRCYGGFGLSKKAIDMYCKRKGTDPGTWNETWGYYSTFQDPARDDPDLVDIVETLGYEKASACLASLKIVEVPDRVRWHIVEYDGMESVAEDHRSWN